MGLFEILSFEKASYARRLNTQILKRFGDDEGKNTKKFFAEAVSFCLI